MQQIPMSMMLFNVLWANPTDVIVSSYLKAYERIKGRVNKPIATWIYGPNSEAAADLTKRVERNGFPGLQHSGEMHSGVGVGIPIQPNKEQGIRCTNRRCTAWGARCTEELKHGMFFPVYPVPCTVHL